MTQRPPLLPRPVGAALTVAIVLGLASPLEAVSRAERTARVAAASCLGEVGYRERDGYMPRLDECRAVLDVYRYAYDTRWRPRGGSLEHGIRRFSAAIRPRASHPRPWLLDLARTGETPVLNADGREAFDRFLDLTRRWVAGEDTGTPCPGATDYGGPMDGLRPGHEVVECESGLTRNTFRRRAEPTTQDGS